MASIFDTLTFSDRLQAAGAAKPLADETAKLMREMILSDLVTRKDMEAALMRHTLAIGAMLVALAGLLLAALPLILK